MVSLHNGSPDVTIAGAGPCGSVLAYDLARKGLKVLLIEKCKLPRNKICAGGITVRATSLLPFDFQDIVENVISGVRLSFRMVPQKVRTYDKPVAYMVMRDKFDFLLVSKAREAGASVLDGLEVLDVNNQKDSVLVRTSAGNLSTQVLVGADGANSAVVHSLGIRAGFDYGVGLNSHVPATSRSLSEWDGLMGLDYGIPGGYAWIFPKNKQLSVGAGGPFRQAKRLRNYTLSLAEAYRLGSVTGKDIQGHLMPLRKSNTPLSISRVLLVGDAAGVIDPLTGEGIYYGLKSVFLASKAIEQYLGRNAADLTSYDDAIDRELMPELITSRTIQKMNTITPRLFFHFLKENDRFWRAFCGLLRGERTYLGLKSRLSPPLRLVFNLVQKVNL